MGAVGIAGAELTDGVAPAEKVVCRATVLSVGAPDVRAERDLMCQLATS